MGNFRTAIFVVVTSLLFSLSAIATASATSPTCGTNNAGPINYQYCVFPSKDANNKDLILHFHGLGGNAMTWNDNLNYQNVRKEIETKGKSVPTVITVSLGKLWLLTEVLAKNNRYNAVANSIIPFLERLAGFDGTGKKILIGESMGGFNALQMFMRNPNTFAKVAVICPAVADLSPWSSKDELNDFIRRTGAQSVRVAFFMDVAADEFPTPQDWHASNPLLLAAKLNFSTTQFYLSGDERDEYGFYEGAQKLNEILKSKFSNYEYDPVFAGGHCAMNTHSIARFLSAPF